MYMDIIWIPTIQHPVISLILVGSRCIALHRVAPYEVLSVSPYEPSPFNVPERQKTSSHYLYR